MAAVSGRRSPEGGIRADYSLARSRKSCAAMRIGDLRQRSRTAGDASLSRCSLCTSRSIRCAQFLRIRRQAMGSCGRTAELLLAVARFSLAFTQPKPRLAGVSSGAASAAAGCRLTAVRFQDLQHRLSVCSVDTQCDECRLVPEVHRYSLPDSFERSASSASSRGVPDGSVCPEHPAGIRGRGAGQFQPEPAGLPPLRCRPGTVRPESSGRGRCGRQVSRAPRR